MNIIDSFFLFLCRSQNAGDTLTVLTEANYRDLIYANTNETLLPDIRNLTATPASGSNSIVNVGACFDTSVTCRYVREIARPLMCCLCIGACVNFIDEWILVVDKFTKGRP